MNCGTAAWDDWLEIQVRELLKNCGWTIEDANRPNRRGAPMHEQQDGKFRSPDFEAYKGYQEDSRFVEVKGKCDGARRYGLEDEYRHGVEQPQYDDYRQLQDATGKAVWLFIYEDNTGDLLVGELDKLDVVQRTEKLWPDAGGAVLFRRDDFNVFDPHFDGGQSKLNDPGNPDPFDGEPASKQMSLSSLAADPADE